MQDRDYQKRLEGHLEKLPVASGEKLRELADGCTYLGVESLVRILDLINEEPVDNVIELPVRRDSEGPAA